ncbi:phosphoglycerol transferase/alkaline phosphatase superfamily protein [Fructobacillus ficulneus]|uniref:Phosphoglycerol transferase/alkaline phosphatase superfamily protein n=2 Tax=Fructobacillus ficulneus TaxID=157463 RepID=A0A0K8MG62_9LACO|nr:phosphoglycerol transferase/alkaline phosphatase superfamily protein [Fructobacillus ficulneus]
MVILFAIKTYIAYDLDFNKLHITKFYQLLMVIINPFGFTMLVLALPLLFRTRKLAYGGIMLLYTGMTTFLYISIVYFREFTDYMTVNVILNYSAVNQGGKAAGAITFSHHDFLFWIDIPIILLLLLFRVIREEKNPIRLGKVFTLLAASWLVIIANLALSEIDRPQLLTRQFDREYLVKYLGIGPFTVLDGYNTFTTSQVRKSAKPEQLDQVKEYIRKNYAGMNPTYAGKAKGKNVIVIHLESFQQFAIDRKINGQEITPFLNSLEHSQDSIAFDNFFHQVGQGKTSDAENLLETSTFGLPQGSLFAKLGNDQTFQAMPAILNQRAGYSSAVFHGNTGTFWNRSQVYKNMGYQNWVSGEFFDTKGKKSTAWGVKDKLLFKDSVPYLERLPQPFYVKYLTVSNHIPYELDNNDKDPNFQTTNSGSKYIDNYFETNHYLDQAVKEFFDYLKKSGLYDNTMVVLYGDHYGINNTDDKYLAPILGKSASQWTDLDSENLQRTPLIIHIPGLKNGGVDHTYGGEVDVAPTIEHLLGVSNKRYIQFGQDLLSKQHSQVVAMRDKDWISPNYASISGTIWDTKTGQKIKNPTPDQQKLFKQYQDEVDEKLAMSDSVNQKNLLRFYNPEGFKAVDAAAQDYSKTATIKRLLKASTSRNSTSLIAQNGGRSTVTDYVTNAPEINDNPASMTTDYDGVASGFETSASK